MSSHPLENRPVLSYEVRIGVVAPRARAGRDTIGRFQTAAAAAGRWLGDSLADRENKATAPTTIHWNVRASGFDADRAMAHALSNALGAREKPEDVPIDWLAESSEFIVAVWPDDAADRCPSVEKVIRDALDSGRKVIAVDPRAPGAHLRWLALGGEKSRQIQASALPRQRSDISIGLMRVSAFNQDCAVSAAQLERERRDRCRRLSNAGAPCGITPDAIAPICEQLVPLATKAELVAQRYKTRYLSTIVLTHVLAAAAVGAGVLQAIFTPAALWPALFEIAAMATGLALVCIAGKGLWLERFVYARYLAEKLRLATYSAIASFDPAAAFRSQSENRPLLWGAEQQLANSISGVVSRVIEEVKRRRGAEDEPAHVGELARFVHRELIEDQREWHLHNARQRHARLHLMHRLTHSLFAATILMAVLHVFHVGAPRHNDLNRGAATSHSLAEVDVHGAPPQAAPIAWRRIDLWIVALAILMPLSAGALHGISWYLDDDRVARRSEQIAHALGEMHAQAEQCRTRPELDRLLAGASNIMAAELYDWLVETSFRRPEVVV